MNIPVDTAFRATWVPDPVDFGTIIGAATSVVTALLDEITGGTPPYTINSIVFVGGAPALGVTITQTTTVVTGDTIAITQTVDTPAAPYSGTIRATVTDNLGASIQVDVSYDFVTQQLFASISDFLDALDTTHRWKCDEAAGPTIADSGSGTTRDMTEVGTLIFNLEGPDDSTLSIDGDQSSEWMRNSVGGMDTDFEGTVLFFIRNLGTGVTVLSNNNTANETSQIQFGKSPVGTSPTNRIGVVQMTSGGFTNRRGWTGDTDITSFNTDNAWHLLAYTADGVGRMKMYIDGVEETVSTTTSGTPPADTSWLSSHTDGNMRVVAYNGRFATASGNNVGQASEMCVLNGTILDSTDLTALFDLVTN